MLNPHRGQLKSGEGSRRDADRLGCITLPRLAQRPRFGPTVRCCRRGATARFSRSRVYRIASDGAAARNTTRRCAALPTQWPWALPIGQADDEVGLHKSCVPPKRLCLTSRRAGVSTQATHSSSLLCGGATLSSAPTSRPTVTAPPERSISSSPGSEGGHPPFRDRSAPITETPAEGRRTPTRMAARRSLR